MMISTKGRYALRFLVDVAEHQGDGYVPLKDVAARQEISEKYLEIVVKELVKGGLLAAARGKGGGYRLDRPPEEYRIKPILELMEGPLVPVACLEPGRNACPRSGRCRTLSLWRGLEQVISDYLAQFTLAALCGGSSETAR
ncbi:MAG: Rrf2 family transcriptional regulator [Oscillospiraceae bacterium]|jgi:Rrf2 family iron-sulfur cluster assembly transcriptional regulator|nr:Rrf2 family transcriptional regulator [Oscillospiraceae bacterium]